MFTRSPFWLGLLASILRAGCTTRPINAPSARIDHRSGYRFETRPQSFVLPPQAVDHLRAAAGKIRRESPDFQRLVREMNASKPPQSVAPPIEIR